MLSKKFASEHGLIEVDHFDDFISNVEALSTPFMRAIRLWLQSEHHRPNLTPSIALPMIGRKTFYQFPGLSVSPFKKMRSLEQKHLQKLHYLLSAKGRITHVQPTRSSIFRVSLACRP